MVSHSIHVEAIFKLPINRRRKLQIKLDNRHKRQDNSGWENRVSEFEAQASVYVILSKSQGSVKGSVSETTGL